MIIGSVERRFSLTRMIFKWVQWFLWLTTWRLAYRRYDSMNLMHTSLDDDVETIPIPQYYSDGVNHVID